jgi:hypothetical protein
MLVGNYKYNSKKKEYKPTKSSKIYSIRQGELNPSLLFINHKDYYSENVQVRQISNELHFRYDNKEYVITQTGKTVAECREKGGRSE